MIGLTSSRLASARPLIPELKNASTDVVPHNHSSAGFLRVMGLYQPKILAFISLVISIGCSLTYPLFGRLYTELLYVVMSVKHNTSMLTPENASYLTERDALCTQFLIFCFAMGALGFLQKWCFLILSENLIFNARCQLLESMLYKQASWFDRKDHSPSNLTSVFYHI